MGGTHPGSSGSSSSMRAACCVASSTFCSSEARWSRSRRLDAPAWGGWMDGQTDRRGESHTWPCPSRPPPMGGVSNHGGTPSGTTLPGNPQAPSCPPVSTTPLNSPAAISGPAGISSPCGGGGGRRQGTGPSSRERERHRQMRVEGPATGPLLPSEPQRYFPLPCNPPALLPPDLSRPSSPHGQPPRIPSLTPEIRPAAPDAGSPFLASRLPFAPARSLVFSLRRLLALRGAAAGVSGWEAPSQ